MKYEIKVSLKPDILNVEAKEVLHAVHSQGFGFVKSLLMAKSFIVEVNPDASQQDIQRIAKEILTNEIIEDYSIHKIDS